MESSEIKKLSEKNFTLEKNLDEIKKNYEISYGKYEAHELKKAINNKSPFYIKNNFIIGYSPENNKFISDKNDKIFIERMVKAVIIEDVITQVESAPEGDYFAIIGKNLWVEPISEFNSIIGDLKVGEIYLPPHSVIFNFVKPTENQIKEKIVSMIEGVNINIYSKDNYIDNCFHEIGHIFWRDCVNYDEKQLFKKYFEYLKPSAIYEYEWERSSEEEVFCTIYKWLLKSFLLNPSFSNILEYEEPEGLKLLQNILDRKSKDLIIADIWELNKKDIFDYINPGGKTIVKKSGTFDRVKNIELPDELLNDVNSFQDGVMFINLNKAVVPVVDNKIDWDKVKT